MRPPGGILVGGPVLLERGRLRFVQEQVLRAKKTHSVEAVIHGVLRLHSSADICIQSDRRTVERFGGEAFFCFCLGLPPIVALCS